MPLQQLKLWNPGDPACAECVFPTDTLSEYYTQHYREENLLGARPSTLEGYEQALQHWRHETGDPPFAAISRPLFARFIGRLLSKVSKRTTRKHALLVNAMIEEAGFPTVMTRKIRETLRQPRGLPDGDYTAAEIAAILAATSKMQRSIKTHPVLTADFWRLFVACAYYLGEHRDEILSLQMIDVDMDTCHIRVPARQKTRKGNYKAMHPELCSLIQQTWSDRERLCPWKNWDAAKWTTERNSRADFNRRFKQLLKLAGLPPERRRLGTRGFRKAHLTRLAEVSMADAQTSANHADLAVTLGYYVSGKVQLARRQETLDRAIMGLPAIVE